MNVIGKGVFFCLIVASFGWVASAEEAAPLRSWADVVLRGKDLKLATPGQPGAINYKKYGRFEGVGTNTRPSKTRACVLGVMPNLV